MFFVSVYFIHLTIEINHLKTNIMTTTIILSALFFGSLIAFNSDLEKVYNYISKLLFDRGNICKY